LIKEINRVIAFELAEGIFKLNPQQKERILEGRKEYKSGKALSEIEANKRMREWLTK